jgi:Mg2+/Co2+ transporter CorB
MHRHFRRRIRHFGIAYDSHGRLGLLAAEDHGGELVGDNDADEARDDGHEEGQVSKSLESLRSRRRF